jgi:hypothetical protein
MKKLLVLFFVIVVLSSKWESSLTVSPKISIAGLSGSKVTFVLNLTAEDACLDRTWSWPDGTTSSRSFDCEDQESDTEVRQGIYGAGEYDVCVYLSASGEVKKKFCERFVVK